MRGAVALVARASVTRARARAATRLASAAPRNLEALEAELAKHDDLYYNAAAPTLSDGEYDALAARVDALRAAHALAPRAVGGDGVEAAVAKWLKKAQRACKGEPLGAIVCEPKLDGLSVSLRYEDGALVQAATRGDGVQGDDVTANARAVAGVVESLGARGAVEIRGEVCVAVDAFRELAGADAANPRNYAAGSLRQSDAEETRRRRLRFVAHDAACAPALAAYHAELARRPAVDSPAADELRYEIDGAVFKVDGRGGAAAGSTARAPRSRVALNCLGGADVGDAVLVKRAGDVIPQIRPAGGGSRVWAPPAACPCCGARTVVDEDAGRATCPNGVRCDDQAAGRLAHFVGRGAIDLASGALGKKKLRQLVREGFARSPADLFDLLDDRDAAARRLEALDGWASTRRAALRPSRGPGARSGPRSTRTTRRPRARTSARRSRTRAASATLPAGLREAADADDRDVAAARAARDRPDDG
ncbi:DNA ligase [Aureococcus anophagefferens]|nr:DNA ligase [Aureococcus anophagefferens]